ncbi:MAG: AGE family epimerase/isomerase, partial [Terracidiphilus sp.]
MKHLAPLVICLACLCAAPRLPAQSVSTGTQPTKENYLRLATEVDKTLHTDVLQVWFPRSVDYKHGGFHSHFARNWKELPSDGKFSVFQGRMTWVAAQVVLREPALKDQFIPIVRHGVDFLADVMWDKQYGGFFWGLDDEGKITS